MLKITDIDIIVFIWSLLKRQHLGVFLLEKKLCKSVKAFKKFNVRKNNVSKNLKQLQIFLKLCNYILIPLYTFS